MTRGATATAIRPRLYAREKCSGGPPAWDHGGPAVRPRAAGRGLPYEREDGGRPIEVAAEQPPQQHGVRGRVRGPVGGTHEGGRAPEFGGAESSGGLVRQAGKRRAHEPDVHGAWGGAAVGR